jgi:hypothetical protein
VRRCRLMWLGEFAFQACSFNHSDISPYLDSTTCERSGKIIPHAADFRCASSIASRFSGLVRMERPAPIRSIVGYAASWRPQRRATCERNRS